MFFLDGVLDIWIMQYYNDYLQYFLGKNTHNMEIVEYTFCSKFAISGTGSYFGE